MGFLKKNWEVILGAVIGFVTMISGIVKDNYEFAVNSIGDDIVTIVFNTGFVASICFILYLLPQTQKKIDSMTTLIKQEQCIFFESSDRRKCEEKIVDTVECVGKGEIYFFCYGTNLFGRKIQETVELIQEERHNKISFKINLVMCNPNCEMIKSEYDKEKLIRNIDWCIQYKECFASLYLIDPPKAFRGCMVKQKKALNTKAVRAMLQSYIINPEYHNTESKSETLLKTYGQTPLLSADLENGGVLEKIADFLDRQFESVSKNPETIKLIENGKYSEEEWSRYVQQG